MLRESHTALRAQINLRPLVAIVAGLALCQMACSVEPVGAFSLGKRKPQETQQTQSTPAFDPTASPLEPDEKESSPDERTDPESALEKAPGAQPQPAAEPSVQADPEPAAEPASERNFKPISEPVSEQGSEPVAEPISEPASNPDTATQESPAPVEVPRVIVPASETKPGDASPQLKLQLAPPLEEKEDEHIFTEKPKPKTENWERFEDNAEKRVVREAPANAQTATTVPADKKVLKKSSASELIHRQDFSGQFSYVLPDGWRTYQIPFQKHDVLTFRLKGNIQATISFADQYRRGSLEKLKDVAVDTAKQLVPKYELVAADITTLPDGRPCAKIVGIGEMDEGKARQLQYIFPLTKKHHLIATLTVDKFIGDKYDNLMHDVVASVSTEAVITRMKEAE